MVSPGRRAPRRARSPAAGPRAARARYRRASCSRSRGGELRGERGLQLQATRGRPPRGHRPARGSSASEALQQLLGTAVTGLPAASWRTRCSMARRPSSSGSTLASGSRPPAGRPGAGASPSVGERDDGLHVDHRRQALDGVQRAEQLAHGARAGPSAAAPRPPAASRCGVRGAEQLLRPRRGRRRGSPRGRPTSPAPRFEQALRPRRGWRPE